MALSRGEASVAPEPLFVSTSVVISQFQVAGGTSADEFVELHNVGSSSYDLNGHRVVYRSAAGTSDVAVVNWAVSTVIPAGGYYLIGGAGTYDGSPPADITWNNGTTGTFAAAGGGLAIRNGAANTGTVLDSVGYGTATNAFVEGAAEPAPAANASAARQNNGCTDTDNNSNDFVVVNPSTPRSSVTTAVICGGGGGTPTLNIGDVTQAEGNAGTTNFVFTVSLTTPAQTGGVSFTVNTADGTTNPATAGSDYVAIVGGSGSIPEGSSSTQVTVQVNGDTTPEPNETFFVNISNVTNATPGDVQGLGTITNDDVTTTPIYNIQGSGMTSPLTGQSVTTTGVVTGKRSFGASNYGFYIQDPTGDGNTATSDALLVFTGSTVPTVSVGDSVQVTGTVAEFESATSDEPDGVSPPDPKTATELTSPTINVLSSGNSLPAPLPESIFNPAAASRGAELEQYEYMRVSVNSLTVSEPTNNNFGEFWGTVTGVPRPFREPGIEAGDPVPAADDGPYAGSSPPNVPRFDGNFERIMVDSGAALTTGSTRRAQIFVTTGAVVTNIVGPLDFAFNLYRIVLDANLSPGVTPGITAAVPVPTPTALEFTISHANLENFSSSNATKLNKASLAIRNVLHTPDVVGLIEVDSTASAQALADKINGDVGNPSAVNYVVLFNDTAASQDIGYLVNTARVTVNGSITPYHAGTMFTYCGVTDTLHDRPSLVLNVDVPQVGGGTIPVTVILNHTKSLIAVDSPQPFGTCGTGTTGARNREKRRLQAEDIADLIQTHINENLVVLGDLNAFDFNDGLIDVVGTLKGNPPPADQVVEPSTDRWSYTLTNLINTLPANQRYSFAFEGNAQALDHVLVNSLMLARNTRFIYGRYNGDFSNDYATDSTRPERVADHDAPVAYFSAQAAAPSAALVISEFRLNGPGGAQDEFVELYNNSDSGLTVQTTDGSSGYSIVASSTTTLNDGTPRVLCTINNTTVIPARAHFLCVNSAGYSLGAYPAGNNPGATSVGGEESVVNVMSPDKGEVSIGDEPPPGGVGDAASPTAVGDASYTGDTPLNAGLAVFSSSNAANFTAPYRLDSVGSAAETNTLYKEGAGYTALATTTEQYSLFRRLPGGCTGSAVGNCGTATLVQNTPPPTSGNPQDTGNNAADFLYAETMGADPQQAGARLGAPGPENLSSPIVRGNPNGLGAVYAARVDACQPDSAAPNRVRDTTPGPAATSSLGTLDIRKKFTNNTANPVTRLRFRIMDITTYPNASGVADLRAVDSTSVSVSLTSGPGCTGGTVTIYGTTVETPPAQPLGGAFNSTMSAGVVNLGQPLAPSATVYLRFLFGVQASGKFRVFVTVEALP